VGNGAGHPSEVKKSVGELAARLRSRQSTADGESARPPGFDDMDEKPTVSSKDKPG